MNENLQKYYEYLKSVKADVPATYDSFATTMGDETQAKTYYNYLKTNKFDTPDTFDSFTETLGLKKKGISGEVSATASQGSSTQPQPLTSDEINKNYQDLLSKSYPPENPFIQVAESTKPQTGVQKPLYVPTLRDYLNRYGITPKDLDMAENANLDRQLRPGEQENYDQTLKVKGLDKKPPTSYFWGTLKEQGLMPASLLRDMDNTVKFLASLPIINKFTNVGKVAGLLGEERTKGGLLRHSGTFGTTADWMENQLQNTPNLPQTDIGKVVGGVIGLEPMFLEMGVMPQGKLATIAGKDIVASRFLNQMVAKGFTSGYAKQLYKEPEKVGKATVEGLKQAGISGAQAVAFSALGYGSSKLGQAIVEETKSGVAGVASNILANSTGFAGYTFMEQVLSGQPVDKDAIKQSALLGGVLALQPFAEFALNRAVGNYLTSSPAVEQASQELNGTPAEARDQSADIREQAKSEPDVQKQASQETGANLIDALADVKVISDEVKKDPMPFIKAVEESDLPKEQQEIFKQKIFDTAKQAVPEEKLKAQQDIDDLQQQIKDINDNEALPEEQRKLDVAPLKEKLKVKQEEFANIKIKEPIKKEEEQTNASKNRTGNQQKPEEGTPETKQGSETIGDVRNNEQTGTTEQQKQEEVTAQSKEPIKVLPNDKKVENIPPVQENKPFTFLEHKANIEQKLKGSPIADKLSPEVKKIFDRLLTEQETPVEVKTEASLPLSPESGTPTPPEEKVPEKPLNELEKPNEREKTLLARFKNAKNLSDVFKEHVDKNGMTYEQIPNNITVADVDALIAENGVGKTENEIYNTSNDLPPRVRALASVRVVKMLDSFADEAAKEGDTKAEADYRLRSVKIAEFVDNTVREWGRGIQILASDEVNATLAPKSAVIMAKRAVRRQRDRQQKYFKKDIDKKAESMKEANKQSIDEAMASKIYSKAKSGITGKPDNVIERDVKVSVDKIKREQEFRKPHWEALKQSFKRPGASLSAGVIPLSAEQVTAITQIVGSYVREGYYRTEILAKKLAQDWKKFVGEDLSEDDAIKMLPQEIEGKKLSDLQNEGGKIDAATKLANRVERMLQDPKTPKYDPVKQMVETLFKKIQEKDIKEKEKPERKSIISVIKEAIQNRDEYSEVWDAAKAEIKDRLESSSDLSEQQKADYDNRLEDFYKEVIGQPFAEKQVEGAVKKEIKDLDISIDKVVKEHYTVYDATKRTLQEKLIDELGVSGDDAKMIADAVSKEFDKKIGRAHV